MIWMFGGKKNHDCAFLFLRTGRTEKKKNSMRKIYSFSVWRELCGDGVSRVDSTSPPAWHEPGMAVIPLMRDKGTFPCTHLHGYCRAAFLSQPQHTGKCFVRQKGNQETVLQ